MQRVSTLLPSFSWEKTKTDHKKSFDKVWGWADKLGVPINRLSNRIGSEAFWPMTLDKESDKAARILRSFCSKLSYSLHWLVAALDLQEEQLHHRLMALQLIWSLC